MAVISSIICWVHDGLEPLVLRMIRVTHDYYCNTLGVCHQLSNGFELKHDMLSGDEGVKIKSTRVSSNLNLDNAPLFTCGPLSRLCKSKVKHAYFMYITSTCIYSELQKSFMKFRFKKSHEMISYNLD